MLWTIDSREWEIPKDCMLNALTSSGCKGALLCRREQRSREFSAPNAHVAFHMLKSSTARPPSPLKSYSSNTWIFLYNIHRRNHDNPEHLVHAQVRNHKYPPFATEPADDLLRHSMRRSCSHVSDGCLS